MRKISVNFLGGAKPVIFLSWFFTILAGRADPIVFWGANFGSATNVPVSATNVIELAAGDYHYLALRADGTVVAWGRNNFGQTNVPPNLTNVVSIAAGSDHCLALRRDGTLALWGEIIPGGVTNVPPAATNIVGLALGTGAQHALVLRADGTVLDWGNIYAGLTNIPPEAKDIVAVAAASLHCLALRSDGKVVIWGDSSYVPASATNIVAIAAGWGENEAIRADGTMLAWGNSSVQSYAGFTNLVDVAGSSANFNTLQILAAREDGTMVGYGGNLPSYPTNSITAVAAGGYNGLALVGSGPPFFQGLPVNRTVAVGSTAYLRMKAVGALPLSYQWSCNGTNLPGATNSVLVLENVQPIQAGNSYSLIASNALGMATNGAIILQEVPSEGSIQPQNLSIPAGAMANFTVTNVVGLGPFTYQWQFNNLDIAGATNMSLSLTNVQLDQAGIYSVVMGNGYGSVTNHATLKVRPFLFNTGLTNLLFTTNGLRLQLDSIYATQAVVILSSTDLVNWSPLFTNPPAVGSVLFLDKGATNLTRRFYKAIEQ